MQNATLTLLQSRGYQMIGGQLVRSDSHATPPASIPSTSTAAGKRRRGAAEPAQRGENIVGPEPRMIAAGETGLPALLLT